MDNKVAFGGQFRDRGAYPVAAVVALILVAVVGVGLLPLDDGGSTYDPAGSTSPEPSLFSTRQPRRTSQPSPPPVNELWFGKHLAAVDGIAFSFALQSAGWSGTREFGSFYLSLPGPGSNLAFHGPARVYADPCAGRLAPAIGPSAADLAQAVATIPGIHATRPREVTVGGLPAKHVTLVVRDDAACPDGQFFLWETSFGGGRNSKVGHTISIWIVDVAARRLIIVSEAPKGSDPPVEQEIHEIIDSIEFDPAGRPWMPPPIEAMVFPSEGELVPGWYTANVELAQRSVTGSAAYAFGFKVPPGWTSSGPDREGHGGHISTGTVSAPDGAIIRFTSPERIYTDPCTHTLGPPLGPTTTDLAAALAAIPGVDVSEPTDIPLGFYWSTTAKHVLLTIGEDLPCSPGEGGFYLWSNEGDGAFSGPRWATSLDANIRAWIFKQEDRSNFPRILIEAETYQGVSPELEEEIWQIVDSIWYYGG